MSFASDFREFINRGNVIDLAVGVIIGGAFATITKSLTDDIIMPVIGWMIGDIDFANKFIILGPVPDGYEGSLSNYAELKEAGVAMLGYGTFITACINFLLLSLVIFILVKRVLKIFREEKEKEVAAQPLPSQTELPMEIRDQLKKQNAVK